MRFMTLDKDQEIIWPRVILAGLALLAGAVILLAIVSWVVLTALTPAPVPAVPVKNATLPAPAQAVPIAYETPPWPDAAAQVAPVRTLALQPDQAGAPGPVRTIQPDLIAQLPETSPGLRDRGQYFVIQRDNVTGGKDLTIKTTVYGWRQYTQIKWYSDGLGYYLDQFAPKGEKYVFVFLASYVDGDRPEQDPRPWYFPPHQFRLQIDGRMYDQDQQFVPAVRIKDLEEIENYNGIRGLVPYGYYVYQERGTGKKTAIEDPVMQMGRSNAKDGYLVFRVPENARPEDMALVGTFGSWGVAGWRLEQ